MQQVFMLISWQSFYLIKVQEFSTFRLKLQFVNYKYIKEVFKEALQFTCIENTNFTHDLPPAAFYRVDPDSPLHSDLQVLKEKEGVEYILLNFSFKVSVYGMKNCR